MPIMKCQKNGKPGYKYGDTGKCYLYVEGNKESESAAKQKAKEQAKAIEASKSGY